MQRKPSFLDCPPRYTRTPRTDQSGADYGSAVERSRDTGYSWLWWATISAISIVGFVVVVATA